jgi:hypothetical protein
MRKTEHLTMKEHERIGAYDEIVGLFEQNAYTHALFERTSSPPDYLITT